MSYALPNTCELGKKYFFPSNPAVIDPHYSQTNVNTTPVVDGDGYYSTPPVTNVGSSSTSYSILAFGSAEVETMEFDLKVRTYIGPVVYIGLGAQNFSGFAEFAGLTFSFYFLRRYTGVSTGVDVDIRLRVYVGASVLSDSLLANHTGTVPFDTTLTYRVRLHRPDIIADAGTVDVYLNDVLLTSQSAGGAYVSAPISHTIKRQRTGDWVQTVYIKNPYYIGNDGLPSDCEGLVQPSDGATEQSLTPTVSWSAVSGAGGYQLEIYRDTGLTDLAVALTSVTPSVSFASQVGLIGFPLDFNQTYSWRFRSFVGQVYSAWSDTYSFSTEAADLPFAPIFDHADVSKSLLLQHFKGGV